MKIAVISQTLVAVHNARDDVALFKNGIPIAYYRAADRGIRISPWIKGTLEFRLFESYLGKKAITFRDEDQAAIRVAVRDL